MAGVGRVGHGVDDLAACSVDAQAVALTFDDRFENFATRYRRF
jgi:hypothetical protein